MGEKLTSTILHDTIHTLDPDATVQIVDMETNTTHTVTAVYVNTDANTITLAFNG